MKPAERLLEMIRKGEIKTQEELELQKIKQAEGGLIKNSEIAELLKKTDKDYEKISKLLQIKAVRTASGVANIAVMWKYASHENSCPANCIYCPQGSDEKGVLIAPKSYTGVEPSTQRAIRNDYDPKKQVKNRVDQLNLIGHSTDKCELIIMGGTFPATPKEFQEEFVKACLEGFNGKPSASLQEAQQVNETAKNRCIGLTIETRADYCSAEIIDQMLKLGCTRVEIGVQSTDNDLLRQINRGHDSQANKNAIKLLKEKGLKVCAHWMPGLTGLSGEIDEEKELEMFKELIEDYQPDELKIYPTLVIEGTKLYELWREGKYVPLENNQMFKLLVEFKKIVPPYMRIKRVMRDISEHKSQAGVRTTNLRQLVKESGVKCKCIRCREVEHANAEPSAPYLQRIDYRDEIFLSYENGALLGFLRLHKNKVRELHVYGKVVPISEKGDVQHTGIGKMLLTEAEKIVKQNGNTKILVTSGIGAREYYRKLGYVLRAPYMVKNV